MTCEKKTKKADNVYVICALANDPVTIPGSVFTHQCSKCQRHVMLSPSGQAYIKRLPGYAKLVCLPCTRGLGRPDLIGLTAGSVDGLKAELKQTVPNTYRNRN